jgi:uncharacterized repeat protein (TIGR03803 family)
MSLKIQHKKSVLKFLFIGLLAFASEKSMSQVYVSPNQPGRAGGNTQPADPSLNTVVTSTYYGTDGSLTGQGTLIATDKNPAAGTTTGSNTRVLSYFKGWPSNASYSWYTTPFTASDGNMYGNSFYGGANNLGAVYKFSADSAQSGSCISNTNLIYSMGGTGGSYGNYANLNELSDGKLYIPETAGGTCIYGKVTKMSKDGTNVATIHDFCWGTANSSLYSVGAQAQPGFSLYGSLYGYDGAYPYGFPVEGPDGYVYGTTLWGGLGVSGQGYGTVYKMQKDGSNFKILAFGSTLGVGTYNSADGSTVTNTMPFGVPWGNVAFDQAGEYAYFFGGYIAATTFGNICRVKLDGTESVQIVHKFLYTGSGSDPYYLYRGPTIIGDELFGTTYYGGSGLYGTAFKIDLSKLNPTDNPIDANGVNNTLQIIHNFSFTDGAYPYAGLIYDGTYLYGSTQQGGASATSYGTIYKLKTDGTEFQTILDLKNETNTCPAGTPASQQAYYVYYTGAERVTLANLPNPSVCYSCIKNKVASGSNDSLLCDKTIISSAPVAGTASTHDLVLQVDASAIGCKNITLSGSGLSLANNVTKVCFTTTGLQTIHVPINYDGTALGTANISIVDIGSCIVNLASPNNVKKAVMDVWTTDNCNILQLGPKLK